ncbi:DnaD domain-containing protein [Pseudalkalibacillus berkeleyi]|uniref:DnaD domain-containing protein n=1 Tax=Pseudalkalibacillus berkeleyi TaxID=1069813 RepID=A0ABS9H197_9BACL|nr:DnaD domain-containing protein [Pseudalkalibacillus berkeleyi]MCF6137543.1 DnaD domain-containing protein [Pseudalkalibacillus berkeleyi]
MKKESFINWMDMGNISIPNALLMNYTRLGLDEQEMMVLVHMHSFIESGNFFPTPGQLSARMTISAQQCMQVLRTCIQKGMLKIEEQEDTVQRIYSETYTLRPLWEKMIRLLDEENVEQQQEKQQHEEMQIYTLMEKEFGRPLSPIECETLSMWLDQDGHEPSIIVAALKEAVLSGKLNFRYIDRILFEWKKNGVRTVDQAKQYGEKFRQQRYKRPNTNNTSNNDSENKDFPYYNWLEQS